MTKSNRMTAIDVVNKHPELFGNKDEKKNYTLELIGKNDNFNTPIKRYEIDKENKNVIVYV